MQCIRFCTFLFMVAVLGSCSLFDRHTGADESVLGVTSAEASGQPLGNAPADAIRRGAYIRTCPTTHHAMNPWAHFTVFDPNTAPNDTDRVVVESVECGTVDSNDTEHALAAFNYDSGRIMDGLLYQRGSGWGRVVVSANKADVFLFADHGAVHPVGHRPDCLYHSWPSPWPRLRLPDGTKRVTVRYRARVYGNARVQIGADYYPEPATLVTTQPPPDVVEAGTSRWAGAEDGVIVLELGK